MNSNAAPSASAGVRSRKRSMSSHSRIAKNDSHAARSDGLDPSSAAKQEEERRVRGDPDIHHDEADEIAPRGGNGRRCAATGSEQRPHEPGVHEVVLSVLGARVSSR